MKDLCKGAFVKKSEKETATQTVTQKKCGYSYKDALDVSGRSSTSAVIPLHDRFEILKDCEKDIVAVSNRREGKITIDAGAADSVLPNELLNDLFRYCRRKKGSDVALLMARLSRTTAG